ncbi:MAG: right-handed parallel beta-helix repeat-containing protein [Bryobacteraceae bacterium]
MRRRRHDARAVKVLVRGGTYFLDEPLVFGPEDSGTREAPIVYSAYPHELPVISGGSKVNVWSAEGRTWKASSAAKITQLFIQGRRAKRARTPKHGFFRIDGPSSQTKPFSLHYRGTDIPKSWAHSGAEVIALLAWAEIRMRITAVDQDRHLAILTGDPRASNQEADARYWVENAPDSLDAPGEWYQDPSTGVLAYLPLSGEDLKKEEVIAPVLPELVRLEGRPEAGETVHNISFQGLSFRHSAWKFPDNGYADTQAAIDAPSAFEATGAEEIAIENCAFTQLGGYAIWFGRGSKRNRIVANKFSDIGAGGIKIGESVAAKSASKRSESNVIADNEMHDLGLVYPGAVGVWIGDSFDNTISRNHIHDLFYTAISVGWTWGYGSSQCKGNRIEYNHLHNIGKEMLSDMGAIYTLGVQPGTIIHNNLIHDVASFSYGGWGIYLDEGSTEILVENNVVYNTKSAGFHQHYGRDNVVRNNIFAFGKEFQLMRTKAEPHLSFTFEHNIIYFDEGQLLGSNWSGDGFHMDRNIYWNSRGGEMWFKNSSWQEWKRRGHDAHSLIADPLFVNAENYNFALGPGSPAANIGFQPIVVDAIGPRVTVGPNSGP